MNPTLPEYGVDSADRSICEWGYGQLPQLPGDREIPLKSSGRLSFEAASLQVESVLKSTLSASEVITRLLDVLSSNFEQVSVEKSIPRKLYWLQQVDILMEQIAQVAKQSEVGGINLLCSDQSTWTLPQLHWGLLLGSEYHHLQMTGISVKVVREKEYIVGLLMVREDDESSVIWIESPYFSTRENDHSQGVLKKSNENAFSGIADMKGSLSQFGSQLLAFHKLMCFEDVDSVANS